MGREEGGISQCCEEEAFIGEITMKEKRKLWILRNITRGVEKVNPP